MAATTPEHQALGIANAAARGEYLHTGVAGGVAALPLPPARVGNPLDAFQGSLFLYRKKDGTQVRARMIQPRIAVWTRQQKRRAARAVEKAERKVAKQRCRSWFDDVRCEGEAGHEGGHYHRNGSLALRWDNRGQVHAHATHEA